MQTKTFTLKKEVYNHLFSNLSKKELEALMILSYSSDKDLEVCIEYLKQINAKDISIKELKKIIFNKISNQTLKIYKICLNKISDFYEYLTEDDTENNDNEAYVIDYYIYNNICNFPYLKLIKNTKD